jgi:hypothetical protein
MNEEAERILKELDIRENILAIFRYGSRVYGTADNQSDHDYIIVTKGATLMGGAFRASSPLTSKDWMMQGVLYSRGGFIDAINNYEIAALECLSLKDEDVIMCEWDFKISKWDEKEMVKSIIKKASNSRHIADQQAKTGYIERAKKGMFHALRILHFGLQLKEHKKIVNFEACNEMYFKFRGVDPDDFDTRNYYKEFDRLLSELRS